jgi:predicted metalloendopeptidase
MIGNIQDAFMDIIKQLKWMDSESKSKAIEKVSYK